jgi:uncharacterized protein with HEPN domain
MRQDDSYLLDMLVAARKAITFAADLTHAQFEQSDLHQNAIFKVLEIVGEAASRISDSAQTAHPEIPWQEIVGLRNRVVHVYFEIDLSLVWQIVREDVPALIAQLERLVPPEAG